MRTFVDGFALIAVAGLTLLIILPSALAAGGMTTLLFLALGLLLPTALHRIGAGALGLTADRALILAIAVHAAVECAALAGTSDQLGLAVAAHRIPVGLAVFMLVASPRAGWRYIALLVAASVGGYLSGQELLGLLNVQQCAWLEGFVAGSLLHVVQGHTLGHAEPASSYAADSCCDGHTHMDEQSPVAADTHDHSVSRGSALGAAGALLGLALVVAVLLDPHHHHGAPDEDLAALGPAFVDTLLDLALTSAPALLLGYLLAGIVCAFLRPQQAAWLSGGSRLGQAAKGVGFGLPLPICSCGVLPLYQSFIRTGVPMTAAIAFLIATPELGLDALLLSLPLLGETMTLLRLVAALGIALGVALLLGAWQGTAPATAPKSVQAEAAPAPVPERLRQALHYGFVELLDHTLPWIALGLVLAALLEPLLNASSIAAWSPFLQVPLLAALSIPAYVCASGATPIAAIAIAGGVSPGAALAFLITGPATNVTTFGILSRLHGRAFALAFGCAVALLAILVGWTVDASGLTIDAPVIDGHAHDQGLLAELALGTLCLLSTASLFRQGPRGIVQQIVTPFRGAAA